MKLSDKKFSYQIPSVVGFFLLLFAAVWAFWPAFSSGFIWNDDSYVTNNPMIRSFSGLWRAWFDLGATEQYYPLVFTTFFIEFKLWGLNPIGFHAVNIFLHALASFFLWRVLQRINVPGAFWAALLFCIHPLQVESVVWITERKNTLSGVFFFATLLMLARLTDDFKKWPSGIFGNWKYWVAFLLFTAALLSKTVTSVLPVVVLILIWYQSGHINWRYIRPLVLWFFLGGVLGLVTVYTEKHHVGASGLLFSINPIERVLVAGRAICFYFGKLIWPFPIMFFYPRWNMSWLNPWLYAFPGLVFIVGAYFWRKKDAWGRGPFGAFAAYIVLLFPALGFFNVYPFRFSFVADHFQYLAAAAPLTLLVSTGFLFWSKFKSSILRALFFGTFILVLGIFGAQSRIHSQVFKNNPELWTDTLSKNPNAFLAEGNLGVLALQNEHWTLAETHFRRSVSIEPRNFQALSGLGAALLRQGKTDEAYPFLVLGVHMEPRFAEGHYFLAEGLLAKNRIEEAWVQEATIRALRPDGGLADNLKVIISSKKL